MSIDADTGPVWGAADRFRQDLPDEANRPNLADAEAAGNAHHGWLAAAENRECVDAWRARLRQLGQAAEAAADTVTQAMDLYLDADRSAADELRRQAQWLEQA